jgi:NADH:ubiquinone oxidoreductase subunit F (NADH-binding)
MSELLLPCAARLVPQDDRVPLVPAAELARLLEEAGLTGRGGAGFPTHRKLAALLHHPAGRVVVVGNGMEGEPLSHKDAFLLTTAPDLVLDGLAVVASALGAHRAVLAVAHAPAELEALATRRSVELLRLPDRFVAGQESALVNAVDGRPGVPGPRHRPVRERGVDRRPTLVLNVETLAQLALLVRRGAAWWREAGTPDDPGTFLVTVSRTRRETVEHPGVLEVERGTRLRDVLARCGTALDDVAAVLVGGFHGAWVTDLDVPLERTALAAYGASTGAGVLHVLDRRDCPVEVTAGILGYLAEQSAGQCGPCVNGLPALAQAMRAAVDAERVEQLCRLVERRGACAHPDGTARLARSTVTVFADHLAAHAHGSCR